ncbi:MAG: hypothetical protein HQL50_15860 [Magnetococcales bacterium]|nr:hypothetical protein [Magnetococcales bacterium]
MIQFVILGLSSAAGVMVGRKIFLDKKSPEIQEEKQVKSLLKKAKRGRIGIELQREYVIKDDTLILAEEDVPLDNTHGNRVLVSEMEFARSANVSLQIDRRGGTSSSWHAGLWSTLDSWTSGQISRSLGVQVGGQVTRRVVLRLSCDPGRQALYRVIWKQQSRRGVLEARVGRKVIEIPYLVNYGLSYSLESIAQPEALQLGKE